MDGLTGGWTDRATCRVACMQLKCINDPSTIKPILEELRMNLNVFLKAEILFYGNFLFCVSQEGMSEDL